MLWRHALSIATGAFAFAARVSAGHDAPEGMVWIPGGEFSMGAAVNGRGSCEMAMPSNDAEPIHRVRVDGFWMDKTAVTNEQFANLWMRPAMSPSRNARHQRGIPHRPRRKPCGRFRRFFTAGSRCAAKQSFPMVDLCKGRELAASSGTGERHQGKREIPGCPHRLSRCRSVREMGRQTFADRS